MPYSHGIYVQENPTSVVAPIESDSAIQFIVGTAPINLLADPTEAVNKPLLINSFAEAQEKVGYSDNFSKFSLCQSIDASFRVFNVAPLIVVNVLDPATHKQAVVASVKDIVSKQIIIEEEGILLNSNFVVKNEAGAKTYVKDTDYTLVFTKEGYVQLDVIASQTIDTDGETKLTFDYEQLDPTAVTESDIIGGYDQATGKYTGLENINQVYPRFGLVVGQIVIPGWSHKPSVGIAMTSKTESANSPFKCVAVKDIDAITVKTYSDVPAWKNDNSYIDKNDIVLWPMTKIGEKKYYMSAIYAALVAYTDYQNDGVPYVSPSNKALRITGTILDDGTEVFLDQVQGNFLNGNGIVTAINLNGWRSWGNNTGCYPAITDVKERFISVRRMFNWWGNSFILSYFQKVDDPMNKRLIETLVDSENIRANGFKARFQIADARLEFNISDNPETDLLNGITRVKQYLTPFPPAEAIINTLEFDATALTAALQ